MPHEPPPPQAEGRNTLLLASVESSVEPLSAVMTFSPSLMSMVTSPDEVSLAFAIEKQPHQEEGYSQKGNDCNYNSQFHVFRISFKVRTEYRRRS